MKSKKLVVLGLFSLALLGGSTVANAAQKAEGDPVSVETEGVINFEEDETGEVVDPEEPNKPIIPEGGGSTTGLLRLQYVPDFKFGTHKVSAMAKDYNPKGEIFKIGDEMKLYPQFVQVTDLRENAAGWKVKVRATKFTNANGSHTLDNTNLIFNKGKIKNSNIDDEAVKSLLTSYTGEAFTVSETDKVLFETKPGQSVTDSISTLILNEQLQLNEFDLNPGVILRKAATDVPKKMEYKSIITWSIEDAK